MLQPSVTAATFRARPAFRSGYMFEIVNSPIIGTNGVAATANVRIPIAKGRTKVILLESSLVATVAAAAATYTITVGKRTTAGVDVPLTTAQSVLAAGITALGGLNRTLSLPQVANLSDTARTLLPDEMLYIDLAITTLTTQPTLQLAFELLVQE